MREIVIKSAFNRAFIPLFHGNIYRTVVNHPYYLYRRRWSNRLTCEWLICDSGCKTIRTQRNFEVSLSLSRKLTRAEKVILSLCFIMQDDVVARFSCSLCLLIGCSLFWRESQVTQSRGTCLRHGELTKSTFTRYASIHWLLASWQLISEQDHYFVTFTTSSSNWSIWSFPICQSCEKWAIAMPLG